MECKLTCGTFSVIFLVNGLNNSFLTYISGDFFFSYISSQWLEQLIFNLYFRWILLLLLLVFAVHLSCLSCKSFPFCAKWSSGQAHMNTRIKQTSICFWDLLAGTSGYVKSRSFRNETFQVYMSNLGIHIHFDSSLLKPIPVSSSQSFNTLLHLHCIHLVWQSLVKMPLPPM